MVEPVRALRAARRALAGRAANGPRVFVRHAEAWQRARLLVQVYDWLLVVFVLRAVSWLPRILRATPDLLWPVKWIDAVGVPTGAALLLVTTALVALAAAAGIAPRACRGLAVTGLTMLVALDSSYGKIDHHSHAWLYTGFVLSFFDHRPAPPGRGRRLHVQRNLAVFWLAQALVLLFYSLTGVWKLVGLVVQGFGGSMTYLSPGALAIQVAHASLISRASPLAAPWIAAQPGLAWLAIITTIYLEVFAFAVAFRPALQRVWALALIAFHVGVLLTMTLDFTPQAVVVALLFLRSPFAAGRGAAEALRALPLVAPALARLRARSREASQR